MAVWLSLSLSQGTPNVEARTTTVSATLTIHYSGGSYDGTEPSGTITIDGQSFPFVKNFNYAGVGQGAVTQGTGSTSITVTATVPYGSSSSRTVYASASFSRASGAASQAITLTSISSGGSSGGDSGGSSGGSSGGDDGGSGGDDGDGGGSGSGSGSDYGDVCEFALNFNVGEHCKVEYRTKYISTRTVTSNQIALFEDSAPVTFTFVFTADEGYVLDVCSIDGVACDGTGTLTASNGEYTIVATAVPVESGSDETVYPYVYRLNFVIRKHCKVEVYQNGRLSETITESTNDQYSSFTPNEYTFVFVADEGYKPSGCSIAGVACDGTGTLTAYTGEYKIIASAVQVKKGMVFIDDGTEYAAHECHIDNGTEYAVYECYIDNGTSWEIVGVM